jgi:hypothetical protein
MILKIKWVIEHAGEDERKIHRSGSMLEKSGSRDIRGDGGSNCVALALRSALAQRDQST